MLPDHFLPDPAQGRLFLSERLVRLGDTDPKGRLRLDAVARYLQDVAEDDAADAGWPASIGWLLRRCALSVASFPVHRERVELRTFCSATGPRWAERTTTVRGDRGGLLQARALWVAVDARSGRPTRLGELFELVYGPSAAGRTVASRLSLPGPPAGEEGRPWPLRSSDLDVWGHVNNAVHWEAVEDELAGLDWLPSRAEMEYTEVLEPSTEPSTCCRRSSDVLEVWLVAGGRVFASSRLCR